jgi:hypothetical protein
MKVYERIVISIATGAVLEEQSFDYSGPVALCGSGGGGGYEPDKEYNARIAKIAEKQADIGTEAWNYYQYGVPYNPNEVVQGAQTGTEKKWVGGGTPTDASGQPQYGQGNSEWDQYYQNMKEKGMSDSDIFQTIGAPPGYATDENGQLVSTGEQTGSWQDVPVYGGETTLGAQNGYDPNAVTPLSYDLAQISADMPNVQGRAELETMSLEQAKSLMPLETELTTKGLEAQIGLLPLQEQSARGFYDAALNGVNPETWGSQAQVDVEQSFQGANADARREAARMGLNPRSGNYANQVRQAAIEKARLGGGARSAGRRAGENENFRRLGLATQTTANFYGGY